MALPTLNADTRVRAGVLEVACHLAGPVDGPPVLCVLSVSVQRRDNRLRTSSSGRYWSSRSSSTSPKGMTSIRVTSWPWA